MGRYFTRDTALRDRRQKEVMKYKRLSKLRTLVLDCIVNSNRVQNQSRLSQ